MIGKIGGYLILFLSFVLIINFSKDIWRFRQAEERMRKAEEKLKLTQEEQKKLLEKKEYYQSEQFIEKQIRDKLQMAKPGETILILPPEVSTTSGDYKKLLIEEKREEGLPNWKKWLNLFY